MNKKNDRLTGKNKQKIKPDTAHISWRQTVRGRRRIVFFKLSYPPPINLVRLQCLEHSEGKQVVRRVIIHSLIQLVLWSLSQILYCAFMGLITSSINSPDKSTIQMFVLSSNRNQVHLFHSHMIRPSMHEIHSSISILTTE